MVFVQNLSHILFEHVGFLARSALAHSHKANDKDRLQHEPISQDNLSCKLRGFYFLITSVIRNGKNEIESSNYMYLNANEKNTGVCRYCKSLSG